MKEKILIVGGAGYVGSMLAKKLINDGNEAGIIEFLDNIKKLRDSSIFES